MKLEGTPNNNDRNRLKRELRRLWRSMDFVSRHPSLENPDDPAAARFAEIYQQLGMLWEFLSLQCQHWEGYRKSRSRAELCKICGKVKGTDEHWLLLPRRSKKNIGCETKPTSDETFPNKKKAAVLNDSIDFHGTKLTVDVNNAYRPRLLNHDITISADRIVRINEGGVECSFDTHLVRIRLCRRNRRSGLPYSAFPAELPRKLLKQFPVLLEYDERDRFVGATIFKPASARPKR